MEYPRPRFGTAPCVARDVRCLCVLSSERYHIFFDAFVCEDSIEL
jgi:hypothetical protein